MKFQWFIQKQLESNKLNEKVIDKYIEFTELYEIDTLNTRRALGEKCGESSEDFNTSICKLIYKTPSLRPTNPTETCIYPELLNFQKVMIDEK